LECCFWGVASEVQAYHLGDKGTEDFREFSGAKEDKGRTLEKKRRRKK